MDQPLERIAPAIRRGATAAAGWTAATLAFPATAAPLFVQRTIDTLQTMPPLARYVLVASVLTLLVAIPLKVMEARRRATPRFDGRDLRWWLNPEWRAAVYN